MKNTITPILKIAALCFFIFAGQITAWAQEAEQSSASKASIRLKPAKCVSLHQGQVCYADVELNWQAHTTGSYCLLSTTQTEPLACWTSTAHGEFKGEVSSDTNVVFTLTRQGINTPLATAEMKMAWVYKKKRSSVSWRVF